MKVQMPDCILYSHYDRVLSLKNLHSINVLLCVMTFDIVSNTYRNPLLPSPSLDTLLRNRSFHFSFSSIH